MAVCIKIGFAVIREIFVMNQRKLIIYSDFICPFCYIGKVNAERLKEQIPNLEIEWREFELHPEGQPDPESPYMQQELRAVKHLAKEYDIEMREEMLIEATCNSRKALLGLMYARERGKEDEYRDAVYETYWAHGRRIDDSDVLREIARKIELDEHEFTQSIETEAYLDKLVKLRKEAHIQGITGVPTFIYGENEFVGVQSVSALRKLATS